MAAACPLSQDHPDIAATLPPPHCRHSMISHWLESPRTWATANSQERRLLSGPVSGEAPLCAGNAWFPHGPHSQALIRQPACVFLTVCLSNQGGQVCKVHFPQLFNDYDLCNFIGHALLLHFTHSCHCLPTSLLRKVNFITVSLQRLPPFDGVSRHTKYSMHRVLFRAKENGSAILIQLQSA